MRNLILFIVVGLLSACGGGGSESEKNDYELIADAGPDQNASIGELVTLDAGASFKAGESDIIFKWKILKQPEGSHSQLSDAEKVNPTFIPDVPGEYTIELVVSNDRYDSIPSHVSVFVSENHTPIAIAGNRRVVPVGGSIFLDATGSSDLDGYDLSYTWKINSKPTGSVANISSHSSSFGGINYTASIFDPDVVGDYLIELTVSDQEATSHPVQVTYSAVNPTIVNGILHSQTVWTKDKSPYLIDRSVQVGSTLMIEPGVEIYGGSIYVFGSLECNGTSQNRVYFDGVRILPGTYPDLSGNIDISFARILRSEIWPAGTENNNGFLSIKDSIITNGNDIYLVYPQGNPRIERNIFVNSGGITVALNSNAYLTNNVFIRDGGMSVYATYYGSKLIVQYNSFLETNRVFGCVGTTECNVQATYNYWGTEDIAKIDSMISDKNDYLGSNGLVEYDPFLREPNAATPDPSVYLRWQY